MNLRPCWNVRGVRRKPGAFRLAESCDSGLWILAKTVERIGSAEWSPPRQWPAVFRPLANGVRPRRSRTNARKRTGGHQSTVDSRQSSITVFSPSLQSESPVRVASPSRQSESPVRVASPSRQSESPVGVASPESPVGVASPSRRSRQPESVVRVLGRSREPAAERRWSGWCRRQSAAKSQGSDSGSRGRWSESRSNVDASAGTSVTRRGGRDRRLFVGDRRLSSPCACRLRLASPLAARTVGRLTIPTGDSDWRRDDSTGDWDWRLGLATRIEDCD